MHHDDPREPAEYLVEHVREALAADDRVNQLDIDIRITGNEIVLMGTVQTDDRRHAIEAVTRSVLPHHRVVNEISVVDLDGATAGPGGRCVRVAAVADIHIGRDSAGHFRPALQHIVDDADLLLIGGDLTRHGTVEEAAVLGNELSGCGLPVVAVLGNHDHQSDRQDDVMDVLVDAGVTMLEGTSTIIDVDGISVGVAGTKGFGGGFAGRCGSEFGERIMKDFIGHTRSLANRLGADLQALDTDVRIALLHFSPTPDTLRGEPLEIYPWLGSYLLAEAIDHAGCDWVFHGHAHAGTEAGATPGGVPVRNVAQPVIGAAYKVYDIVPSGAMAGVAAMAHYR